MSIKWTAIIHAVVSVLALIPLIGLATGIALSAANSNTGARAYFAVYLSVLFAGVLLISIIVVWGPTARGTFVLRGQLSHFHGCTSW